MSDVALYHVWIDGVEFLDPSQLDDQAKFGGRQAKFRPRTFLMEQLLSKQPATSQFAMRKLTCGYQKIHLAGKFYPSL